MMVLDTGAGMDADEIRHYRDAHHKRAESSGYGLGLAVCFELAVKHGLDLEVTSEKGRGTAFALAMPMVRHVHTYSASSLFCSNLLPVSSRPWRSSRQVQEPGVPSMVSRL
jgi:hypothetical protein